MLPDVETIDPVAYPAVWQSAAAQSDCQFEGQELLHVQCGQLKKMLGQLNDAAAARGLELHPDKTKILSSKTRRIGKEAATHADVNGMQIEILERNGHMK